MERHEIEVDALVRHYESDDEGTIVGIATRVGVTGVWIEYDYEIRIVYLDDMLSSYTLAGK